ncbi:SDR family oxidoreductase [Acetobacter papayae]|uniref:SDR family oxidoreductase n=1 Tax=Acetobacter papayae TaxID=1076592 RepID=UPI00046F7327
MHDNITGKVIVITGASSGLGAATARYLAERGAKLVLGARRLERLKSLAWDINLPASAAIKTDVTDPAQVQNLVNSAVQQHGRIE